MQDVHTRGQSQQHNCVNAGFLHFEALIMLNNSNGTSMFEVWLVDWIISAAAVTYEIPVLDLEIAQISTGKIKEFLR